MPNKNIPTGVDPVLNVLNNEKMVTDAIQAGITESLRKHRLLGNPICVWRDGKVVWIPPNEIKA